MPTGLDDVRFRGKTGSHGQTGKMTRMTRSRHHGQPNRPPDRTTHPFNETSSLRTLSLTGRLAAWPSINKLLRHLLQNGTQWTPCWRLPARWCEGEAPLAERATGSLCSRKKWDLTQVLGTCPSTTSA